MKKQFFVLFMAIGFGSFAQTGIKFEHTNWSEIVQKAKKENKLIFMDAYTSWCGPCKMMSSRVFTDKNLGDYFNKNFINAKIDMEEGEGPTLAAKYPVRGYPTLFFIDPNSGSLVNQALGFRSTEQLLEMGTQTQNQKKK